EKIQREHDTSDVDVVIPIPDTSRTSAMEVANRLNVKYREGFIKNRYIGRTFIMPGQDERKRSVRQKLNPINLEFRGKNVLLVDDSIVRGTTSRQIVEMSREAGARKVYFASAAPPVRYQNVYGIDMPAPEELIAANRTVEEVEERIGADWLVYQDLGDLISAVNFRRSEITGFDVSCFNGQYVTGGVDRKLLRRVARERADKMRASRKSRKRRARKAARVAAAEPVAAAQPPKMAELPALEVESG
ncbi:MAG: hypothetical protein F4Z95_01585, partial [Gammaproteobacteria bacterium]|nr:hypothetical protein [Gammaproteobacteria bacterium]